MRSSNTGSLEEMQQAFEDKLAELGGDVMSSCNSAIDIQEDDEYLDQLCTEVQHYLDQEGYDAYVHIDTDSVPEGLAVEFEDSSVTFSIPLEDIEPNWDDLMNDADTIAKDAIDFYDAELNG